MRRSVLLIAFFSYLTSFGQITEDFGDGDFTDGNPLTWAASQTSGGDDFVISSGEIQSNGPPATGDLYLSTDLGIDFTTNDVEWVFKVRYTGGAPSSSNYVRVFLMSDVSDISGSPNGYYIRMGESGSADGIDLFKTSSGTAIINDGSDLVASGIDANIRVTRLSTGDWTLEADNSGGTSFANIGSVSDTDFTSGSFFGFRVNHSSTRNQSFFMDDVIVTITPVADTDPPTIQSVTAISDTEVDILFNETVDQTTAETSGNYVIDQSISVLGASRDGSNDALVHLTTSSLTNGTTYALTINNVEDESNNVIAADSEENFEYLVFSEAVEFDVVINEFMPDPNPVVALPDAEFVELYNRSSNFFNLENWELDGQTLPTYTLAPDSYVLIVEDDDVGLFGAFSEVLTITTLSLSNSSADVITLVDDNASSIHEVSFEGSSGGTSTELINPNGPDYSSQNYGLSTDADGGTPGEQNSIFDDTPDTTPPSITSVNVVSSIELEVTFDEFVTEATAETAGNYSIDGGITVLTAERDDTDNTLVRLTVSTLTSGETRTLTVNGVEDLSGNAASGTNAAFEYIETEEALPGDVVINEFLPLPNDGGSLPNAEFIELYNTSSKFIDLAGWTIQDRTSTTSTFSSTILRPGDYLILTESGNGTLYDSYGDVLEVGSLISLNNSGDDIILRNAAEDTLSQITYAGSESGISWEMINPNGPDYSINNYGLSTDADGGTPGEQNSIFDDTPDTTPPSIASINVVSSTELEVTFDEFVSEATAEMTGNYTIDGGVAVPTAERDDTDNTLVRLTVSTLTSGETRTLTVNGVEDLSGNASSGSNADFEYIETEAAVVGDIVINEFLPLPNDGGSLPNAEFIELYNTSSKFIDLAGWTIQDRTSTTSAFSSTILRPGDYLILTETGNGTLYDSYGDVLEVGSLISLNNSGDDIILRNATEDTLSQITYSSSESGISWEMINPNGPDYSINNYGLSTDPDGGTPGEQNSIFDDTPDTTSPSITSVNAVSSTELEVTFDEFVTEATAETTGNYSIDGSITVSTAERDDTDNTLVRLTVSTLTSGDTRTLTVTGVEDLSGNAASGTNAAFEYIETEAAVVGDIVINEFMPLPNDGGSLPKAEFIELYNTSSKFIDLENWTIQDRTSTTSTFSSTILRPGDYLILTESGNGTLYDSYGDVLEVGSLISLNNSGDDIILRSAAEDTLQTVTYTSSESDISWEMINPNGPDYSINNYDLSTDPEGGTPGDQNSIFDDTPDTTPPSIASINVVSNTELEVTFDEFVTEATAETAGNYSIDGGITVSTAERDDTDNTLVRLTVSTLTSGETRTLTVNGVEDLSGNAALGTNADFEYIETEAAVFGDVVINEFLPLPNDSGGLPNEEFIELFNASNKFIDLAGWTIQDRTSTTSTFSSTILRPGDYLILTETGNGTLYDSYGDVLEVGSLISLNNSGDDIILRNAAEDTLADLRYTRSESGTSWEMINPNGPDYSMNNYILSIDPDGGTPGEQNSIFDNTPDTTAPAVSTITVGSNIEIRLAFDEFVTEISAETVSNYIVDGGITVSAVEQDKSNQAIVRLTVSPLTSGQTRTLTINGVEDLSGNATSGLTADFEYIETEEALPGDVVINEFLPLPNEGGSLPNAEFIELYNNSNKFFDLESFSIKDRTNSSSLNSKILRPGGYLILTETGNTSLFNSYGDVLEVGSLVSLNNGGDDIILTNFNDDTLMIATYSNPTSGVSLELINPEDACISTSSYLHSIDANGGTPGTQNSVFDDTPDTTAPSITSFGFTSSLTLNFSEVMDKESLVNGTYQIEGLTISEVVVESEFPNSVELRFTENPTPGFVYELTVSDIRDCPGNLIEATTISFSTGRSPSFNEIIITEIMFDASPSVRLPEREYIEIYNASSSIITTEGLQLSDALGSVNLPSFNLEPGEYKVLTSTSGASEFDEAIGLSGFPSLSNSGEQLLLSIGDELIFSVTYDPDWHEEEKADGGYSLEMIDILNPCVEENNWGSSTNRNGGSPGIVNSILGSVPDNFGPTVIDVTAISSDTVRIQFDEKIDPTGALVGLISTLPSVEIEQLYFNFSTPKELYLILGEDLQESLLYTLFVQNIFDCSGNEVQEGEFTFSLPVAATSDEIKLSEALFNPRSNGVDFVEVYNDSELYISLKDWQLARITDEGVDDAKVISSEELVIEPGSYLVFTTDKNILLTNYPKGQIDRFFEVASLPTYANDTGNVVLLNGQNEVIERFFYDQDYHYDLLESVDGVSLERVSFSEGTNNSNNWRSASSTEGFATPGYANSQSFTQQTPSGNVSIEPKVFVPGNSGSGRDFTTINYQFDNAGRFANVNIYDQSGRLIRNLAQGELLSTSGFLRWDGVTNEGGMARMGYYVVVFEVYDTSGNTDMIKQTVVVGRDF